MDLSLNEWGPGKDAFKLEAWGFIYLSIMPCLVQKGFKAAYEDT